MDEKLRSAISSLRASFPIDAVYVFGSFGRGEETDDSDIDILVVYSVKSQDPFELAYEIRRYLHEHLDRALDVIVSSKKDFDRRLHHPWTIEHIAYMEGVAV
jgi:predicted nucleotidyltransferase